MYTYHKYSYCKKNIVIYLHWILSNDQELIGPDNLFRCVPQSKFTSTLSLKGSFRISRLTNHRSAFSSIDSQIALLNHVLVSQIQCWLCFYQNYELPVLSNLY